MKRFYLEHDIIVCYNLHICIYIYAYSLIVYSVEQRLDFSIYTNS